MPFFPQSEYQCGPAALATVLVARRRQGHARGAGAAGLPAGAQGQPAGRDARRGAPPRPGLLPARAALRGPAARDRRRQRRWSCCRTSASREGWHYAVAVGYDYDSGSWSCARATHRARGDAVRRARDGLDAQRLLGDGRGAARTASRPPPTRAAGWPPIAALERAGDARGARIAYRSFLERWPDNVNAAIGLANAHHALGELPRRGSGAAQGGAARARFGDRAEQPRADALRPGARRGSAADHRARRGRRRAASPRPCAEDARRHPIARQAAASLRPMASRVELAGAAAAGSRAPRRPARISRPRRRGSCRRRSPRRTGPSPARAFCIGARLLQRLERRRSPRRA